MPANSDSEAERKGRNMKGVNFVWADHLKDYDVEGNTPWGFKLARPVGIGGFSRRLKAAWMVFTGKADVLLWKG